METLNERRVALSDGSATTLQQWGERGPIVVAVHGLGSSRRGWVRLGERFAPQLRVVAYDQRGHGDHSASGPMTFERSVADLADVVAALGEPVDALIGHSWGGAVVVAGGRRTDAARVVAVDPMLQLGPGVWSESVLREFETIAAQSPQEREAAIRRSYTALPEIEVEAKLHAVRRLRFDAVAALGDDNGIDAGDWDLRALVHDYPKPLLVAVADPKRSVVPPAQRDEIRARGGAHVTLEVFEGASHSLQRDAFERFVPVLERFLDGRSR